MERKQQIEQAWLHGPAEQLSSFRMGAEWADAHPVNPWVSVKERLPEERKTVLLWFGGYYTAAILRDGEWWNCTGWYSGGGWSALDKIQDIAASYITHWMYIPEPPEQDPTEQTLNQTF